MYLKKNKLKKKEMPDIEMCLNKECELKLDCFRFMAIPKIHNQSFADFKPNDKGECDDFLEMKKEHNK